MTSHASKEPHIIPLSVYLGIGATLLVLTAVTVLVSYVDLGAWNIVVALLIAGVKATLVALVFMHLLYDNKFFAAIFVVTLLFLVIFIGFCMIDTMRRGDIYLEAGGPIRQNAVIYDSLSVGEHHAPDSTDAATRDSLAAPSGAPTDSVAHPATDSASEAPIH